MDEKKKRKPGWTFWITASVVAIVLYVLSYGPVLWLYVHEKIPAPVKPMVAIIYKPTGWIVNQSDLLGTLFEWYVKFFLHPP